MKAIKLDQIDETTEVCPYCMNPKINKISCCGENHFEKAYILDDGEIYLESEVQILETDKV